MEKIVFLLVLIFGAAGCVFVSPKFQTGKSIGQIEAETNVEALSYDLSLGDKIQTTGVHPDDASFLTGETTTNLRHGNDGGLIFGLRYRYQHSQSHPINWILGINGRFRLVSDHDRWHQGIFDDRQQESDERPSKSGAFVYTRFVPADWATIPFVGLDYRLNKLLLGAQIGFPFNEFTIESGHDRYGIWDPVQSETRSVVGYRLQGEISWAIYDQVNAGLTIFHERYRTRFGDEEANISVMGFCLRVCTQIFR